MIIYVNDYDVGIEALPTPTITLLLLLNSLCFRQIRCVLWHDSDKSQTNPYNVVSALRIPNHSQYTCTFMYASCFTVCRFVFSITIIIIIINIIIIIIIIITRTWLRHVPVFAIANPSVCRLSETFVHPTQPVKIFGNVSAPFYTLVIPWPPRISLRRSFQVNPSVDVGHVRQTLSRHWTIIR